MASQLFKMEKKIDTISSDNIREIFKLIRVPSVPVRALPDGLRKTAGVYCASLFSSCFNQSPSSSLERLQIFLFDPCMPKPHPAREKKNLRNF